MKKLSLLACLMTVTTGFALAQQTVSIPFFADNASSQAFVGLQNTSGGAIVVTATYTNPAGAQSAGGTFGLAPGLSISYRPNTTSTSEVQPAGLNDAGFAFGSITFTTSGGTVAGRYVQITSGGQFAHNLEIN